MKTIPGLQYYCMTPYDANFKGVHILFPKENVEDTLGEYLSKQGKKQLHTAETEKYAHVTFFFNGGVEKQCEGEERCLVPSPKEFATYDLVPQMSAEKVETVDACMGRIMEELKNHPDTVLLVTADHGNADCMFDETGKVNTAHTTNPVPFLVTKKGVSLENGRLADISPTILAIMGIEQPKEMTGHCLIVS